jgi:hypothetical protein
VLFFKVLSLPMLIIGVLLLVQALLPIMSGYKQMDLPCTDLRIIHEAHTQSRSYHCGCQEYYVSKVVDVPIAARVDLSCPSPPLPRTNSTPPSPFSTRIQFARRR